MAPVKKNLKGTNVLQVRIVHSANQPANEPSLCSSPERVPLLVTTNNERTAVSSERRLQQLYSCIEIYPGRSCPEITRYKVDQFNGIK